MSEKFIPLGDFGEVIMGLSPKGTTYNENGKGLPLLNGPTEFGDSHPSPTLYTIDSKRESNVGDLIFCVRGSTGRMNWSDQIYSLGRGVCAIRGENRIDTKYIKYSLDNKLQTLLAVAGGGTFPNLKKDDIKSFKIPVHPNYPKIVKILSAYDNLIENNLKRVQLLEEAAQNLYKEWFVNFRFPGSENKPLNKETGLPEGWEWKQLEEVCDLIMGQSPRSEFYNENKEGLPFHQGVTGYGDRFVKHSTYCTKETRIAEKGDILCSVRAPVGRLNISPDKIIIGRGLSAIRNKLDFQSFQYYQLKSHFYQEDMIGGGAIFNSVTKKVLASQELVSPKKEVLESFESLVSPIDKQIETLSVQNENLKEARDLLLPRLMDKTIEV